MITLKEKISFKEYNSAERIDDTNKAVNNR